jgi:predicted alpha/beta superfamily hydrolase
MYRMSARNIVCLLVSIIISTATAEGGESISIGERFTLTSSILGEERPYLVSLPQGHDGVSRLPVLYVLDAEQHFNVFATTIEYLGRDTNIPPMMVVGIPNTAARENNMVPYVSDWSPDGGGADKFLSFFTDELIPEIASNYPTSGFNIIAGKSYGGLFALYAATQETSPFKAYISASPSVFLKDNQIVKDLWENRATVAKAKFIFASHANEDDIMRHPFDEVAGILEHVMTRANSVGYKFYLEERHETVFLPTLLDAMDGMFPTFQSPRYTRRLGAEGVVGHYQAIIDDLELGIEIPERVFTYLGNLTRSEETMPQALDIFREGVKRYPDSVSAEYHLIRSLLKTGEHAEALEHLRVALPKAEKAGAAAEDIAWFKGQLAALEAAE